MILKPEAFPVTAIGDRVYAKNSSSPICTALTDILASEIARRLNFSDICEEQAEMIDCHDGQVHLDKETVDLAKRSGIAITYC